MQAAQVLAKKIENAERRLEEWQEFSGFMDDRIEAKERFYVPAPDSDRVIKNYNTNYWSKELERLQREFDAL